MAETLQTLYLRVQRWLSASNVRLPDTDVISMINTVQKELARKYDLRFFETSDTFNTAIGTPSYALPEAWSRPYQLWYLDPDTGAKTEVKNKSREEFTWLFPDDTKTAKPEMYTIWGNLMYLGKVPDRVITMHREYYGYLADITNPVETNALMAKSSDILFYGALVEASAYMIEDARVPLWEQRYRKLESDLVSEHARAWSSGRVAQSQEPG